MASRWEINNFPGAAAPFGMVQYSPDTVDNYAGYDHANGQATGFSMTHASVGCAAFGGVSMLPPAKFLFALTAYCTICTLLYSRFTEEDVAVAETYGTDITEIVVARTRGVSGCAR